MVTAEGLELIEGNKGDIQDSNKYLGILQTKGSHEEATRKTKYVHTAGHVSRMARARIEQ